MKSVIKILFLQLVFITNCFAESQTVLVAGEDCINSYVFFYDGYSGSCCDYREWQAMVYQKSELKKVTDISLSEDTKRVAISCGRQWLGVMDAWPLLVSREQKVKPSCSVSRYRFTSYLLLFLASLLN